MRDIFRHWWKATFPASMQAFDGGISEIAARLDAIKAMISFNEIILSGHNTSIRQSDVVDALRKLRPHRALDVQKKRFGSVGDGGYVMLDDLPAVSRALSFGIDVNDDWDLVLAKRGIRVDQYDFSIPSAPSSHENLTFHPLKVGTVAGEGQITLPDLMKDIQGPIILKIDIEGHEWSVFDDVSEQDLSRCLQICAEFHGLSKMADPAHLTMIDRVFEKLAKTHRVVHVHANNCTGIANVANIALPDVVEVTFASTRQYRLEPVYEVFPGELDAPNDDSRPDVHLGCFVF